MSCRLQKKIMRSLDIYQRPRHFIQGGIGARITSQSEGAARTEGRRLNTKTSPKGEFEWVEVPSPKGEVLEVKIKVRIRAMVRMLIFLILLMFSRRSGHGLSLPFASRRLARGWWCQLLVKQKLVASNHEKKSNFGRKSEIYGIFGTFFTFVTFGGFES